jgi:hypothetical protein
MLMGILFLCPHQASYSGSQIRTGEVVRPGAYETPENDRFSIPLRSPVMLTYKGCQLAGG